MGWMDPILRPLRLRRLLRLLGCRRLPVCAGACGFRGALPGRLEASSARVQVARETGVGTCAENHPVRSAKKVPL
jgi:hypothetical protein